MKIASLVSELISIGKNQRKNVLLQVQTYICSLTILGQSFRYFSKYELQHTADDELIKVRFHTIILTILRS